MSKNHESFNNHLKLPQNSVLSKIEYLKDNITNLQTNDYTRLSLVPDKNEHDIYNMEYNMDDNCFFNLNIFKRNINDEHSEDDESRESFPYNQIKWNEHTNNNNRNASIFNHNFNLISNPSEEVEENEKTENNKTFIQQTKPEIKTNNNIFNTEPKDENIPQEIEIEEEKPIFKVIKKKWNEYSILIVDYLSYISFIFLLFGRIYQNKGKGRKDNYLKQLPNTITSERSKSGNRPDNFKERVINACFKSICFVISNLFLAFGKGYKLGEINKNGKELKKIDSIMKYLDKKMVDIVKESLNKKVKKTSKNGEIYDRLVKEGKLVQCPLLKTILNMNFGEVLHNFVIDFNFVKDLEPNNNDFHTYNYYKNAFKESNYPDEIIKSTQETLIELTVKYAS